MSGKRGPKKSVRFDRDLLREARQAAELTQDDLADAGGIATDSVRRAERGENVSLETARAIGIGLKVPHDKLLAQPDTSDSVAIEPLRSVPIFVGVPPRTLHFVGREDKLDQLRAVLMTGKTGAITQANGSSVARLGRGAVHGMGGIGKTMLAVEYAHRYRDLYGGVWWCPAERPINLLTSLAKLATELGAAAEADADIEKMAKAALRRLDEQRANFLLVYDNVAMPEDIADLLPVGGAHLLITSRFPDWSRWAEEVELDVLSLTEAVFYLQEYTGHKDEAGAIELAKALGRLPLALDHAAALCKLTQMRFTEYAAKVARLISRAPPPGVGYPRSVAATFELAITEAAKRCPSAELLMDYLAQCAPERIPMGLLEGAITDEVEREAALLALAEVSLVKSDPFEDETPAVTMHRLVQIVGRLRAEAMGRYASAAERITAQLSVIYPTDGQNPAVWPICARLTPHLLTHCGCDETKETGSIEVAYLLGRAGRYFQARASYSDAKPLLERALVTREQVFGLEHPDTAVGLNNLALLLWHQGDYGDARRLLERAMPIMERELNPNTVSIMHNFAVALQQEGDFLGAQRFLERSLEFAERVLGPEHPKTATELNNLALVLQEQKDLDGAQRLLERAFAIRVKALGPEHPDTVVTVNNLGSVFRDQGNFSAARQLFQIALDVNDKVCGPEHPSTATCANNLALILTEQGDFSGARPFYKRALTILEKVLGPEHPDTVRVRKNFVAVGDLQ